jgi:hypothetical protein
MTRFQELTNQIEADLTIFRSSINNMNFHTEKAKALRMKISDLMIKRERLIIGQTKELVG